MEAVKLTAGQLQAAGLVADNGKAKIDDIAEQCGVSARTVDYWKTLPEFKAEVKALRNVWRKTVRIEGISDQELRLRILNDLLKRCRGVIIARAKDPEMLQVPGGRTGLLCKTIKMQSIAMGETVPLPEYRVDTPLIARIESLCKHVADELGQGKQEEAGKVNITVTIIQELQKGRARCAENKRLRELAQSGTVISNQPVR